jgi:putative copper resistance protein D
MLLWGAFAYLAALVPGGLARAVGRRLDGLRVAAIATAVLTTAATLPLQAASIGEGWGDALDLQTLRDLLVDTDVGRAWLVRAVLAVVLAATLLVPRPRRQAATALASGTLMASLALTGHAAMHEGVLRAVHAVNDAGHLLVGGAWLGALVPLVPILRALGHAQTHGEAATALRRFSAAGHGAVALVVATGILNVALVLGRWPTDWTSPYQALLAAKIGLVALMILVAVVNRYVLVRRLRTAPAAAVRALAVTTLCELALGAGVIALVGVFGTLEPA